MTTYSTREDFQKTLTAEEALAYLEIPTHFLDKSAAELAEIASMSQEDIEAKAKDIRDLARYQDEQKQSWFASIQRQIDEYPNPNSDDVNRQKNELATLIAGHENNLTITGDKWRRNRLIHIQNNITVATNHIKGATKLQAHPIQFSF
jgi:hypothetical protein